MPTRLEKNWETLKPEILSKWGQLSSHDLVPVEGRFDRLVEVIRQRCLPQRSALSIEAEIKDWLIERIEVLENSNPLVQRTP